MWRDGQKKRVYIYRMLCAGSIEEKVKKKELGLGLGLRLGLGLGLGLGVGLGLRSSARSAPRR